MRIGHGYDVHRLVEGRRLILGGVVVSLVVYLGFMLKTSIKSLNDLVNKYFDSHKDEEVDA